MKIDIEESITVNDAGRYDAEVITGANIKIEKGFKIPPVKNNKIPNWSVSNNKKEKAFKFEIVLFLLSSK